jgi:hypothetical protein
MVSICLRVDASLVDLQFFRATAASLYACEHSLQFHVVDSLPSLNMSNVHTLLLAIVVIVAF